MNYEHKIIPRKIKAEVESETIIVSVPNKPDITIRKIETEYEEEIFEEAPEILVVNGVDGYTPIKGVDYFDGKDGKQGPKGKDGKSPTKTELKAFIKEMFPEEKLLEKLIKKLPKEEISSIEIGEDQNGQWISKNGKKMYIKKQFSVGAGMSTGVYDFIALRDAPSSYVGQGGKVVKVKSDETGLEFGVGGGGGSVASVTGLNTDNTDPANPIVQISVDGVTITGAGTPGSPLVAIGDGTGDVHGPASAVDDRIATFDGTTGKIIQDGGVKVSDLATAAQGALADSALQSSDIGVTVQAHSSVLDNTTASFTTADETKLDGIEAGADVTDATNVAAAGAVMESDYTPAHSILVQQSGTGSPSIVQIANNTLLGRLSGGGSDIDSLTATEVRTLINVEAGAEVNAIDTVSDTTEIDLTITAKDLTASIRSGSIDETKLDTSVNASLDLADTAVQPAGLSNYFNKTTDDTDDITDTATNRFTDDTAITRLANTSGTNTGDQTITLTGAVTGTGTGSFATTLASGIDATKIADGSISNTEFQYLNGATSNIQAQLNAFTNGMIYKGNWDASAGTFPGGGVAQIGWFYTVSVGGTVDSVVFNVDDRIIATANNASTTTYTGNWNKLDATDAVTSVFGRIGNVVATNGDYTASNITNVPAGNIAAVTVQAAIDELDTEKVQANGAITGATKTKVTYDAKGLVTAGADATTADIADSSNKRYVTDANLTVIGNTSGTNTGDNATNSQYSGLAASKQDTLVSGTNIKTVNSTSLLGAGNIDTTQTTITGNAGTATALQTARTIGTLTGDATSTGSSFDGTANNTNALTLATVNANVGSFGSATAAGTFTVNAKGLVTAAGSTTVTPAVGSITGLGTGVGTALAINVGSAGAPVVLNGAGGTPSSMTATNLTGTASGLTAGNVTTNANLTGVVTSVGNATSIADAALSIAKTSGLQTALDSKQATLVSATNIKTINSNSLLGAGDLVIPVLTDGDKGDITVSASGATWTIDNDVVTYAKIQNVSATDRLLGRDTAGAGDIEELTVSGGLEFTGTGIQRSALTGEVTASAGSNTIILDKTAISSKLSVSPALDDYVLIGDTNNSDNLKKTTITNIGNLFGQIPIGGVIDWAGSTLPTGYLYCDGSVISRTTYADLFTAIGTTFGAGDGSTTYALPDARGRVTAGMDNMNNVAGTGGGDAGRLTSASKAGIDGDTLGASGGVQEHLLLHKESGVPAHSHPYYDRYNNSVNRGTGGANTGSASVTGVNVTTSNNTATDASEAHTNVQPTLVLNKIIRFGI